MSEEIKFTDEELTQIQNIQKSYIDVQNQFGQIKFSRIKLDEQEVELKDALKTIQTEEKTFLNGITSKYGQGTLNPETGIFTPTTTENNSQ